MSSPDEGQTPGFELVARHPRGAGLLLFDLDDTIVVSGTHVSQRVLKALRAARDAGFELSIASGRPLCIVNKVILKSGVMDFALCSNGARVVRLDERGREAGVVAQRLLSRKDALDCYELLAGFRPAWNAFFDGKAYFEWKGASYMITGRTGAIARTARRETHRVGRVKGIVRLGVRGARYVARLAMGGRQRQVMRLRRHLQGAEGGVEKMGCTIIREGDCARAMELLRADGRFEVVRMGAHELEITARGVTKGSGARALMDAVGVDARHAVAFGDGGNDLPLADAVGRFVAMGNADADVKAAAFEVCPSVAEDGVAVWIENMLAKGGMGEGASNG